MPTRPAHRRPLPRAAHLLPRLVLRRSARSSKRGADIPVALARSTPAPIRPTLYEYRPLVGAFVEERAGRLGQRDDATGALAALKDEPAAGIFAQAHADEHVGRGRGVAPDDPHPPARPHGRGVRRLRLGGRRLRAAPTPSSSARCSASGVLRGARAARRPDGRRRDRPRRWAARAAGGRGRARRAGRRRTGCFRATSVARWTARSSHRARRGPRRDRLRRLPTPRRVRARGQRPSARHARRDRGGAGALRAARLAALRRQADAAARRPAAGRRGHPARSVSRPARRELIRPAWRSPRRARSAGGARAFRDRPLPRGPAAGRRAAGGAGAPPRRRGRPLGGGDARGRLLGETPRERASCCVRSARWSTATGRGRARGRRPAHARGGAAGESREILLARSTTRCSACGRTRRSPLRRGSQPRVDAPRDRLPAPSLQSGSAWR